MHRSAVLLLACVLVVLWAVCGIHADRPVGEGPLGASAHGLGCSVAPTLLWLAATLAMLALTGRLGLPANARRLPAPPIFLFHPPD